MQLKINKFYYFIVICLLVSCTSTYIKNKNADTLKVDDVLSKDVVITEYKEGERTVIVLPTAQPTPTPILPITQNLVDKRNKKSKRSTAPIVSPTATPTLIPLVRLPEFESNVGFPTGSRRPFLDPFQVNEKVVLEVSYFKAVAGELGMEVKPFMQVNGRKSYRFLTTLRTTGFFENLYTINDWADTLVDYDTLVPSVYNLNVNEKSQIKQGKGFFDPVTLEARYHEKRYTEKNGNEEKNQKWTMLAYSQNVYSAAFYMRIFDYEVGKEYSFNVAHDDKNILFKGKCLRKEKLETSAGVFNTLVVQPKFEIGGVFKPMGDIFFWLTDDDRKFIVKIEADIRIGTLVAEAISVEK